MPTEVQIYKNESIAPADLSTGGPDWDTSGNLTATSFNGTATGLSGTPNITVGTVTATSFKTSTESTGFLKANGTVDTNTYITQAVPIGGIIMWSGTANPFNEEDNPTGIPTGWALCDGSNSTPDLRNRFVVGAHSGAGIGTDATAGPGFDVGNGTLSSNYTPGNFGGETAHQLSIPELASHTHQLYNQIGQSGRSVIGGNNGSNTTDQQSGGAGQNKFHENRPPYYALAFIMRTS